MLPICESCSTAAPLPRSLHLSLRPELIGGRGGGGTLSNHWAHGAASLEVVGRRSAHACGMGASHHTSTARYGESMALSELYITLLRRHCVCSSGVEGPSLTSASPPYDLGSVQPGGDGGEGPSRL